MPRHIDDLTAAQAALREVFSGGGQIVVLTGAGISTESGIPDYRSPGGIWSRMAPVQYADFIEDKAQRLEDWRRRFIFHGDFTRAHPNAAHRALAREAEVGRVQLVITQNIDGLHQRAGLQQDKLVELHGNGTYASCLSCGAHADLMAQKKVADCDRSPRCADCGGLLKAAVISFGQSMPEEPWQRAVAASRKADVFIVVGSSLQVYPAARLPEIAVEAGAQMMLINQQPGPLDELASHLIRTPAAATFDVLLPGKS
ncbi:SIR2 family NAD-dependent protein deacylase [Pannonibacter phragmitetus]|uniref:SIR2 family NAD-dependent protein deacylase n=1 Tax=Pannonibacter phragmitetus TaxID=121719 RepID=UPI003D2F4234